MGAMLSILSDLFLEINQLNWNLYHCFFQPFHLVSDFFYQFAKDAVRNLMVRCWIEIHRDGVFGGEIFTQIKHLFSTHRDRWEETNLFVPISNTSRDKSVFVVWACDIVWACFFFVFFFSLDFSLPSTDMSIYRKLIFTDICINGHVLTAHVDSAVNECILSQRGGR